MKATDSMANDLPSLVVLMIEAEQPEGLSARKLVVESAKHNVLTAYTADGGLKLLQRFPNVDIVLLHHAVLEQSPQILSELRAHCGDVPVILASPFAHVTHPEANYVVDSHRPQELLMLLAREFPDADVDSSQ